MTRPLSLWSHTLWLSGPRRFLSGGGPDGAAEPRPWCVNHRVLLTAGLSFSFYQPFGSPLSHCLMHYRPLRYNHVYIVGHGLLPQHHLIWPGVDTEQTNVALMLHQDAEHVICAVCQTEAETRRPADESWQTTERTRHAFCGNTIKWQGTIKNARIVVTSACCLF